MGPALFFDEETVSLSWVFRRRPIMAECYCTECDWEGDWDDLVESPEGERCPECNSLNIESIEDWDDDWDDDLWGDDEDEDVFADDEEGDE